MVNNELIKGTYNSTNGDGMFTLQRCPLQKFEKDLQLLLNTNEEGENEEEEDD